MNHPRHDEVERDEDESIDRALASLSNAPIDNGFTQRVTQGVEQRLRHAQVKRPVWVWGVSFATAAVVAVVAAALAVHRRHEAPVRPSQAVVATRRQPASGTPTEPAERAAIEQKGNPVRPHSLPRTAVARMSAGASDPAEEASFPAPPEPLTEQERLLRQIAHTGDRVELATLNPEISDRLMAQDRRQVDAFFYQPRRVDDKGNLLDAQGRLLSDLQKGDSQ